jgi:hypothetical protein
MLRIHPSGEEGRRTGGKAEAVEDSGSRGQVDGGEDAHRAAAVGTLEGIDGEHAAQEVRPWVAARDWTTAGGGRARCRAAVRGRRRDDAIARADGSRSAEPVEDCHVQVMG